ncbi:MAG TPA: hypothetical protein GX706_02790 [Candidatus Moranbacteria bacterium]|nr:hypothetical protein [Candidatus Moranbacteria bacterium]
MKKIIQKTQGLAFLILATFFLVGCSAKESSIKIENNQEDLGTSSSELSVTANDLDGLQEPSDETQQDLDNSTDNSGDLAPKQDFASIKNQLDKEDSTKKNEDTEKSKSNTKNEMNETNDGVDIKAEADKCIKDGGVYNTFARQCFKN